MWRDIIRTCMPGVLLLLVPSLAQAQQIDELKAGVVKITATLDGRTRVGTGVIVGLKADAAYIVTASHVIEGDPSPEINFFAQPAQSFATKVLGQEPGDPKGLAALHVTGDLPAGIRVLDLDAAVRVSGGESVFVIGFPRLLGTPWAVTTGSITGLKGRTMTIQVPVEEGNSGGPVVLNGKVVGIVVQSLGQFGRAVPAAMVQFALKSWLVPVGAVTSSESTRAPPEAEKESPDKASTQGVPAVAEAEKERPEKAPTQVVLAREIVGKDGAPMVLIPAGEFMMGSRPGEGVGNEHPQKRVYLDAFYMDKYEVTTARYAQLMQATGREEPKHWERVDLSSHGNYPVVGADWHDAKAYCEWAGKRLPTEAEWEKAARGTDGRKYPWGSEAPTSRLAIYDQTWSPDIYIDRLKPVDSYPAGKSPYGLYNMAGNVWEWVADRYDENYYADSPNRNPQGPSSGQYRVLRGGSWDTRHVYIRSANRDWDTPTDRDAISGMRCAQDTQKQ